MVEVLNAWKNLSQTAEESTKLSLTKSKNLRRKEYVLVAKFLTKRALNVEAIRRTFKPLWRARNEFKIREAGDHILLIVFELETDVERVLAQEPWSFDKRLILFQRYDYSILAKHLRFTKIMFWVQIHGLPMRMLDSKTTIKLGETLGEVSTKETEKEMVGGDFVQVRVKIDVSKPLSQGRRIVLDEDIETWVSFKYEKLTNFCYWCGMVSHEEKECKIWLARKGPNSHEQQEYGAWLWATPYKPGKSSYTTVSSMGDGLGGFTSQHYANKTSRAEEPPPATPHGEPASVQSSNVQVNADLHQVSQMDTADFTEDLVQILHPNLSPFNRVINSIPNFSPSHIRSQDFENQIEEIDLVLMKFDSHAPPIISEPTITPTHAKPVGDNSGDFIDTQGDVANSNPTHVTIQNNTHDNHALHTWKRLAKNNITPETPNNHYVIQKRNREFEECDQFELPKKKFLVSKDDTENSLVEAAMQPRQEP